MFEQIGAGGGGGGTESGNGTKSSRGRPKHRFPLTRTVRLSKALSLILRHKAEQFGLSVREDGYVSLDSVLNTQNLKVFNSLPVDPQTGIKGPVSVGELKRIVRQSDKQRFSLRFVTPDGTEIDINKEAEENDNDDDDDEATRRDKNDPTKYLIRANQGHTIDSVKSEELLTPIMLSDTAAVTTCFSSTVTSVPSDFPSCVVHGTTAAAWPRILSSGGLSRMGRLQVHFSRGIPKTGFEAVAERMGYTALANSAALMAPQYRESQQHMVDDLLLQNYNQEEIPSEPSSSSSDTVISGMRQSSQVLIFIDIIRALESGLKFWRSENGVILSEGDENGFIPLDVFKVVMKRDGTVLYPVSTDQGEYIFP